MHATLNSGRALEGPHLLFLWCEPPHSSEVCGGHWQRGGKQGNAAPPPPCSAHLQYGAPVQSHAPADIAGALTSVAGQLTPLICMPTDRRQRHMFPEVRPETVQAIPQALDTFLSRLLLSPPPRQARGSAWVGRSLHKRGSSLVRMVLFCDWAHQWLDVIGVWVGWPVGGMGGLGQLGSLFSVGSDMSLGVGYSAHVC